MKLIINAGGNIGGGPLQVAIAIINELMKFPVHEYHMFISPKTSLQIDRSKFGENCAFYDIPSMPFYKYNQYFSKLERKIKPDIILSLYGPTYWRPDGFHIEPYAHGYYIYDDSPYLYNLKGLAKFKLLINKFCHLNYYRYEADAFICETDDVRNRSRMLIGEQKEYYTVSNTCGSQYLDFSFRNKLRRLPERKKNEFRLVTLSRYYSHKNIEIVKKVVDELKRRNMFNVKFILTIEQVYYGQIFGDKYLENVITVGSIPVNEAPSLYEECDAMFLPTLVECFSASYPEAMAIKKPILTSDLGFAHSICQDAALFFDPLNAIDIANEIIKLMNNKDLYDELIKLGSKRLLDFPTANQRAKAYLDICERHLFQNQQI